MNYEVLLDEIMVNAVGAQEIIGVPGRVVRYGVCPLQLEYHTSIFLAGALLAFGQERPLIFLIQVEELPEEVMLYTGEIGPHFGKRYEMGNQDSVFSFPETKENAYPYLDKLFSYLAVLNWRLDHNVLFVRKGVKVWSLSSVLKEKVGDGYSLLVMSNAYQGLPTQDAKELSAELIAQCKERIMDEDLQAEFPAFACLNRLCQGEQEGIVVEHLINTGDMGLNTELSTSLWCMLR